MNATEVIRKIESTLLLLQESAENGDMDPKVYADVLEVVIEKVEHLSTLLSQEGRVIA